MPLANLKKSSSILVNQKQGNLKRLYGITKNNAALAACLQYPSRYGRLLARACAKNRMLQPTGDYLLKKCKERLGESDLGWKTLTSTREV